jgi:hypothetical protein
MDMFVAVKFFMVLSLLIYLCIIDDTPIYRPHHIPIARPCKGYIPTKPSKGCLDTDEPYNPFSNKATPIMRKAKKR